MVAARIQILACGSHGAPASADLTRASSQGVLMDIIQSAFIPKDWPEQSADNRIPLTDSTIPVDPDDEKGGLEVTISASFN